MTTSEERCIYGGNMADVDQSDNPQAQVRYLDTVAEQGIELKIDSYAMLGINGGDRVLDVGCGTGEDILRMAAIVGSFGRAVGLDLSEAMIEQARERSEVTDLQVEFIQGNAYDLPFPDNSFDACRCERVLLHLDDPLAAIREMKRVTRPGGRILLVDPDFGAEMLDTSYPDTYERIRAFERRQRDANPGDGWRGRQLWGLAHQAELESVEFDGRVVTLTSLAAANAILAIELQVRTAVDAGAVSQLEANAYLDDLRDRDVTNRFLAAVPGYFVVGAVPVLEGETGS